MAKMQNTYYKTLIDKLAEYRKQGFGDDQLDEIRQGFEHGINASVYADKEYFAVQMRQIRFGLEERLDISLYNSKQYDWFQMEEIRLGLKDGLDASIYADPKCSYEVMRELRKALKDNIHLEKYATVGAEMLRELHRAILDKQNIMPYIKAGYVPEQLREIRHAMKQGCNIDPYLNTAYRGAAIREITEGLEEGLDVAQYAKIGYSWQQMREIRLGLEARLNVKIYSKELYSWQQMREIRLGLEAHLDVEQYKSMIHSAADMRKIRLQMEQERLQETENAGSTEEITEEELATPEHLTEYCKNLSADAIRFFIEPDRMKAYVYVGSQAAPMEKDQLISELTAHKIRKGLDSEVVNALILGTLKGRLTVLAQGREPVSGEDGYYESFIGDYETQGVRILEDGSREYKDAYLFQKVYAGQKLLAYHEAKPGVDGYRIDGMVLRAVNGAEKRRIKGRGFHLLDDEKTYISDENGCASFRDTNLVVTHLLELETASNVMGDINYNGSVYIKGDAGGNIHVKATGDIVVEGFVENARLESERGILIKKGANGNGEAQIIAAGTVMGRFFENASIHAKHIISNYFFRCNLYALDDIEVTGSGGSIAGGRIYAGHRIESAVVGNRTGIETAIRLGYDESAMDEVNYSEQLKETESQLKILTNAMEEYKKSYPPEVRNSMPVFLKVENAIYTKEKERQDILNIIEQQKKDKEEYQKAYISVYQILYEGTTIVINNAMYSGDARKNVMLRNVAGRIVIHQTKEKME